ncbi:hypothetical protein RO3G_06996 [Lichtheimia corymbifera JMRC:FSU:9682]|uniref:WWE domain-containing protein n=1 Tax=Lichtheimia corymbifera JMRC:FSU:9682 TaxID=1263082 RepID=A0A068RZL1_9FUNG|nr:hypothetical protein RO3G_06996 [Lichtheimia corymbifera JMRC:FSU:9682]
MSAMSCSEYSTSTVVHHPRHRSSSSSSSSTLVSSSSPITTTPTLPGHHGGRMRRTSNTLPLGSNDMKMQSSLSQQLLLKFRQTRSDNLHHHQSHTSNNMLSSSLPTTSSPSRSYFTWLVFLEEKWVPFDAINQTKLEQTLTLGGTFVDVTDSHFPNVKRVRVFPKNNYLSYLGVKYRLSRIMQPDAWLDHDAEREARESTILNNNNNSSP